MIGNMCEIKILDANLLNLTEDGFKSALKNLKPDIVGITVLMDQYGPTGHKAAELVKSCNKDTVVIMGGVYATVNSGLVMKDSNIDYVVIGEGEYVFKDLIGFLLSILNLKLKCDKKKIFAAKRYCLSLQWECH